MAKGTPGLSPPWAVTTSPLPPTAPHPSRALSLAPALCGPHPSAPALGEEEEARERKRKHIVEQGALVQSWSLGGHRRSCSCSGAGKFIGGDTGEMSHHIQLGPSPLGWGHSVPGQVPSQAPLPGLWGPGRAAPVIRKCKIRNTTEKAKTLGSTPHPWETQFLPGNPLLPVFGARM